MKVLVLLLCTCLLVAGTVSAKAADSISPGLTPASSKAVSPGIFTFAAFTDCSDDSAQVGTAVTMGELDIDSIPDGASVYLDGSPWTYKHCIGHVPDVVCLNLPVSTPYTGVVETGTHSISFSHDGYKTYAGTVNICSQKVSYVHKDLIAIATTTTTAPVTTVTTAVTTVPATTTAPATATATTVATATVTTAAAAATTAAAGTTSASAGTGSLSITTTPPGAAIAIDGVQRGVSPALIPGLPAGSHVVILKMEGYQDLSASVSVVAGIQNEFSTGMTPTGAAATAAPDTTAPTRAPAATTKAQSPGFEAAFALLALGTILYLRR